MLSGNVLKSCALELAKVDAAIAAGVRKGTRTGGGCGQWDAHGRLPTAQCPKTVIWKESELSGGATNFLIAHKMHF